MNGWKKTLFSLLFIAVFLYLRPLSNRGLWMLGLIVLVWLAGVISAAAELWSDSLVRRYLHWAIFAGYIYLSFLMITSIIRRFVATTV